MEWVAFKAGDEYLGIEVQYIHRVVDEVKVTPVPFVPCCHMGLMYYRGEVFDVIHVGSLLGQSERVYNGNPRIILLKWSHKKLALVPDLMVGLIWIDDSKREQTPHAQGEHIVRRITPDEIWSKVSELPYGPHKV